MEQMVYLNGSQVPRRQATISAFDHGFLYGYGLFETMRAYNGKVFRLERHLARLARSAEALRPAIKLGDIDLAGATYDTLRANNLSQARVRVSVSLGEGEMVPDPETCATPTVLIVAQEYTPFPPHVYERGFTAQISAIRRNSQSPLCQLKSANYLDNILARQEAKASGADEAILLNEKGFVVEATTSNLFLVISEILVTPPLRSGALPGITRQTVMELATSLGIEAVERDLLPDDLLQADEAFLTNSVIEIMPLTRVGLRPVDLGVVGSKTKLLMAAYKKLVAKETGSPP